MGSPTSPDILSVENLPTCDGSEMCCYVGGKVCDYSVRDKYGRAYACELMAKYGVPDFLDSPEYKPVGDFWAKSDADLGFDYCYTFSPLNCCKAAD